MCGNTEGGPGAFVVGRIDSGANGVRCVIWCRSMP